MALFVDLDEEEVEPPLGPDGLRVNRHVAACKEASNAHKMFLKPDRDLTTPSSDGQNEVAGGNLKSQPSHVQSVVTEAFSCYPVVIAIVSFIDLNTLDALSRTCRGVHNGLVQYRTMLRVSTLRCANEDQAVDPAETFRFRARAGNWYYMEDGRNYNGKSGQCARDMVSECRRCSAVICRNCAIKPPAPAALPERHRRLCRGCTCAPLATLVKPALDPHTPPDSDPVRRAVCQCADEGVWLCQPCGRSIRGADHDYHRIWVWRSQYGEVLGGLGTGIGDGDRGVTCGREEACCSAKEREQETDCDAEDARDSSTTPWAVAAFPDDGSLEAILGGSGSVGTAGSSVVSSVGSLASTDDGTLGGSSSIESTTVSEEQRAGEGSSPGRRWSRTPSPQLGPGYERHEIEGIGGVVKKKLVRMVRVGACVPEWPDERSRRDIMGREVRGAVRSWCGWCWRVIPGGRDIDKLGTPGQD